MISFLLILILCLGMTIPAYAEDSESFADEYYRVNDLADLMTDSEESKLLDVLDEISIRQKMDVIVMTTDTLEEHILRLHVKVIGRLIEDRKSTRLNSSHLA